LDLDAIQKILIVLNITKSNKLSRILRKTQKTRSINWAAVGIIPVLGGGSSWSLGGGPQPSIAGSKSGTMGSHPSFPCSGSGTVICPVWQVSSPYQAPKNHGPDKKGLLRFYERLQHAMKLEEPSLLLRLKPPQRLQLPISNGFFA